MSDTRIFRLKSGDGYWVFSPKNTYPKGDFIQLPASTIAPSICTIGELERRYDVVEDVDPDYAMDIGL